MFVSYNMYLQQSSSYIKTSSYLNYTTISLNIFKWISFNNESLKITVKRVNEKKKKEKKTDKKKEWIKWKLCCWFGWKYASIPNWIEND